MTVAEPVLPWRLRPPRRGATRQFRSPAVRRIADETGLDVDGVAGTGLDGRVTRTDVLSARDAHGNATSG